MYTAESVWAQMWPEIPFEEASERDKTLCANYADSLNLYLESVNFE